MNKSANRRYLRIGMVAGLLLTTQVGSVASGQAAPPPPTVPYGTITIDLFDRSGLVTFDPVAAGAPTLTQALGVATPCSTLVTSAITDPADPHGASIPGTFLNFTGTGGTNPNVQLPGSGIGVTDGANCGEPAGLFGPGETLTLTLGDYFVGGDDGPKVDTATLNIGKTRSPDGSLRVAYGGGSFGPAISIGNSGQFVDVGGPSVADFTSISLRSTATQSSRGLSLKTSTVFDLVAPLDFDAAIDCGDSYSDSGSGRSLTFDRVLNGKSVDPCEDVGVTLKFGDETATATWDNGTTGIFNGTDQDVRGFVTLTWEGVPSSEFAGLQTSINYDGLEAGPFFPTVWCASWNGATTVLDGASAERPLGDFPLRFAEGVVPSGLVDGNGVVTPAALAEDENFELGPVPWCLVDNSEVLDGDEVVQTQILYGGGDPTKGRF